MSRRTLPAVGLWSRYLGSRAEPASRRICLPQPSLPCVAVADGRPRGAVSRAGCCVLPLLGLEFSRAEAAYFAGVIQLGCQVVLRLFGRLSARREAASKRRDFIVGENLDD